MANRDRRKTTLVYALVAIAALTVAVVIGLLDAPGSGGVVVVYPRDRDGDREDAASKEAPRVGRDRDDEPANGTKHGGASLALPGALPRLEVRGGREALRRALSPPGRGHVLIDVSAIGRSPLAGKILRCRAARAEAGLAALRERVGLDLERDIDTFGLGSDVIALGGRLGGLHLPDAPPGPLPGERYGDDARILDLGQPDARHHIAMVGEGTLLMADDRASLLAAIDRMEGRAPAETASVGRADVEGVLLGADLETLFGVGMAAGAGPFAAVAGLVSRAGLRVDVDERANMSLDLDGLDAARADQLAGALRAGVGLLRQSAQAEGRPELLELVDQARIHAPAGARVGFDLAVPGEWILARLGCDAEGTPLPGKGGDGDGEQAVPGQQGETTVEVIAPTPTAP